MANPEHLAMLQQAMDAKDSSIWNSWIDERRKEDPKFSPDLVGAGIPCSELEWINLSFSNLSDAWLNEAKLMHANLRGANLSGSHMRGVDLKDASLEGTNLESAELVGANMLGAQLGGASMRYALLGDVNLGDAKIQEGNLEGADLRSADLSGADLSGANLRAADLLATNLGGAILHEANLTDALLGWTLFANIDASTVKGLTSVRHQAPSTIGIDTLYKSHGQIPEVFLRGCGVPDTMITFSTALVGKAIDFYSAFISYSSKDERFAHRIYNDLQGNGVRCWRFVEDARGGESVWGEIDKGIRIHEKVLLLCSKHSLQSGPVLRELERALNREDKEKRSVLFPVALDRYLFDEWQHERREDVLRKVVRDFSGWNRNAAKYDSTFKRLLADLKQTEKLISP